MAKKKGKVSKKGAKKAAPLPGISLEKAVAHVQGLMDQNSTVKHNEKLKDRSGNRRQFDVVIRGTFGGWPMLGVIECKDHNRKKGPNAVEAFAKKAENVGANVKIMVSRKGFTKQALNLAKFESVGCLSLLPDDPKQVGWSVGTFWYGVIRRWTDVRLIIHWDAPESPLSTFDCESVLWEGLPVARWFLRKLFSMRGEDRAPGTYTMNLTFDKVRLLSVGGREYPVKGLSCEARWVTGKKRKWVSWSGNAFFDWHNEKVTIPKDTTISGSLVEMDMSLWPDFDGEIPTIEELTTHPLISAILNDEQRLPDGMQVPELDNL